MSMTSPVALCLVLHAAQSWAFSNGNVLEDYDQPCIICPLDTKAEAKPAPEYLRPSIAFRDKVLRMLGWSSQLGQQITPSQEIVDIRDGARRQTGVHRVTALSFLPSELLARRIHEIFWYTALLPLEAMLCRSVVNSFMTSPWAVNATTSTTALTRLPLVMTWSLASKIGLCVGLQIATDTVVWAGLYTGVRWVGITRFHWGNT